MRLPVYIDGKQEGELWTESQGAATVICVELRDVGRVVRLTVYGERAWYLGVPAPEEGRLRLRKRFTPLQLRQFPQRPEYAADRPLARPDPVPAAETEAMPEVPEEAADPEEEAGEDGPDQAGPSPPVRPPARAAGRRVLWMGGKPYYF